MLYIRTAILTLMYCTSLSFFYRNKDDAGMNTVPTEGNKAYSSHSIKNISSDSNSMTMICLEANLTYTSHSVKRNIGESPEDKDYENVKSTISRSTVVLLT